MMKDTLYNVIVCIVGLGYVGLPLAKAFAETLPVIGFDIKPEVITKLNQEHSSHNLAFTSNPEEISKADFFIICVPTPVTKSKEPDLSHVQSAAQTIGQHMKQGTVVILESTVYPGVMEEKVKPVLENESGLKCGVDFKIAYSPERINPGDEDHSINKVTKVVAGMDEETTELVAALYRKITPQIFIAKDIKTAEAAKVIENIQRDLNIALMNELAIIFEKMGLHTKDVLDTAATKWNFHRYSPGLVGGHCIPVDPYYLVHKARELGYYPQVTLAGRAINDYMPQHIVEMTIKALNNVNKVIKGSKVLIMGLTYKEDVADTRETPARSIIRELTEYGIEVFGYDPLLDNINEEFGIKPIRNLKESPKMDAIILTVVHSEFKEIALDDLKGIMNTNPILIDVRGFYLDTQEGKGLHYRTL